MHMSCIGRPGWSVSPSRADRLCDLILHEYKFVSRRPIRPPSLSLSFFLSLSLSNLCHPLSNDRSSTGGLFHRGGGGRERRSWRHVDGGTSRGWGSVGCTGGGYRLDFVVLRLYYVTRIFRIVRALLLFLLLGRNKWVFSRSKKIRLEDNVICK